MVNDDELDWSSPPPKTEAKKSDPKDGVAPAAAAPASAASDESASDAATEVKAAAPAPNKDDTRSEPTPSTSEAEATSVEAETSAPSTSAPSSKDGAESSIQSDTTVEDEPSVEEPASPSIALPLERKPVSVKLFGHTDVGQIREHNEDNFLVADLGATTRGIGETAVDWRVERGGLLFAVCDGMGGAAAGEVASKMATDIVYGHMQDASGHGERDRLALDIVKSLEEAGSSILAEAMSNRACRGMGTTATVGALVDDHLLLGQVGDSRAYILRGARLVQVTRDQSLVNQLIEAGQLTEEEAENFEHSNIILQALGTADSVQVDLTYVKLCRGDVLMMCSDGLSGMIRDGEIREVLTRIPDPVDACRVLIEEANLAGGHDNISVIVARFDGDGLDVADDEAVSALKYQKYHFPNSMDDGVGSTGKHRALGFDETPSIEVHGEFEVDGDIDWEQLLHDRRMIPNEAQPQGSRTWMWALFVAALVLVYVWFLR